MVSVTMKGSSSIIREWMRAGYITSLDATLSRVMRIASADRNISGIVMRRIAESSGLRLYGIAELPIWAFANGSSICT